VRLTESAPGEGRAWANPRGGREGGLSTDLIDGQVDACIGDDTQHIGQVAAVEGAGSFLLQDPPGTV
jgi:hypothetical protein